MKKRFRLIKIEIKNGRGEVEVRFVIQKRYWFKWLDYGLKCHYYTYENRNVQHGNEPRHAALLTKRYYEFEHELMAKEVLEKLKNPFTENYKGQTIKRYFHDHTMKDVYLNKSYSVFWNGKFGYEYSPTLQELKNMIDDRIKTKTTKVIA